MAVPSNVQIVKYSIFAAIGYFITITINIFFFIKSTNFPLTTTVME